MIGPGRLLSKKPVGVSGRKVTRKGWDSSIYLYMFGGRFLSNSPNTLSDYPFDVTDFGQVWLHYKEAK
jgi:hypothetical protein